MLSRIPSWAVAVSGASLVVVAMVLSSMFLYQIRESIAEERSEIATTRGQINLLWDSHRLADNRSTSADIFVAERSEETRILPSYLARRRISSGALSLRCGQRRVSQCQTLLPRISSLLKPLFVTAT